MSLFIVFYNDIAYSNEDDENYFEEMNVGDAFDKGHRVLNAILALAHKAQPLRIIWCKT